MIEKTSYFYTDSDALDSMETPDIDSNKVSFSLDQKVNNNAKKNEKQVGFEDSVTAAQILAA